VQRRRWFVVLCPIVIQSMALLIVSDRIANPVGRATVILLSAIGAVSAVAAFLICDSAEMKLLRATEIDWSERLGFVMKNWRHGLANDLQVLSGWLQVSDVRRATDYMRQIVQKIEIENSVFKCLEPRAACAVMTGRALVAATGHDLLMQISPGEWQSPYCQGLGDAIEDVLQTVAYACKEATGGEVHVTCEAKSGRWQARVACSAPVAPADADEVTKRYRYGGEFAIRSVTENESTVFVLDFPRRPRPADTRKRQEEDCS